MANDNKKISTHEALYQLHKSLSTQVGAFEAQCLALRKAESAKLVKDDDGGNDMEMAECKGDANCHCPKCEGLEKYAKGETSMSKASNPAVIARMAANKAKAKMAAPPAPKPEPEVALKAELPPAKGGKVQAPKSQEGGNAPDIKMEKAGLGLPAMPKAPGVAAPKAPGAAPAMPKAGAMPKAPAAPKTPAMGSGTPSLKAEASMTKGVLPTHDVKAQAAKLPAVRASVGATMDSMMKPPTPAMKAPAVSGTLPATAPSHQLASVGMAPVAPAAGVSTMAERVASKMPSKAPPKLPGAHLFGGVK